MTSIYWLIVFVVFVGIEVATMALTTIWFAGGAFIAFLLSLMGASVEVQLAVFVIASFLLLFLTRPFASRYINRNTVKTNADSLIGKKARVTEEINDDLGTGIAVIDGKEWTARTEDRSVIIPPGVMVTVNDIRGVKLIVSSSQEEA